MMREAERLAIEWCEQTGVDPLEYVPFRIMLNNGGSIIREVPRYLAICGGFSNRSRARGKGVAVH